MSGKQPMPRQRYNNNQHNNRSTTPQHPSQSPTLSQQQTHSQSSQPTTTTTSTPATSWAAKLKQTAATSSTQQTKSTTTTTTSNAVTNTITSNTGDKSTQPASTNTSHPSTSTTTQPQPQTQTQSQSQTQQHHQQSQLNQLKPGCSVVLFTTTGERITGTVYTYCAALNTLALELNDVTYTLLNTQSVSVIESIQQPSSNQQQQYKHKIIDNNELLIKREERNIQERINEASTIGTNVTVDAQRIFDNLVKTVKCKWQDQSIVVMDSVIIDAPDYNTARALNAKTKPDTVDRVKKMLSGIKHKLALSDNKNNATKQST